ncbi:unnamed protein product [Ectocarpus sp. 12 AP-2014]
MLRARHVKWKEWPQIVVDLLQFPVMSFLHIAHSSTASVAGVDAITPHRRVLLFLCAIIIVQIRTNTFCFVLLFENSGHYIL